MSGRCRFRQSYIRIFTFTTRFNFELSFFYVIVNLGILGEVDLQDIFIFGFSAIFTLELLKAARLT